MTASKTVTAPVRSIIPCDSADAVTMQYVARLIMAPAIPPVHKSRLELNASLFRVSRVTNR